MLTRAGASTTRVLVWYKMINMNILKTLYSSTDFPVLVLVCSVLAPALVLTHLFNVPCVKVNLVFYCPAWEANSWILMSSWQCFCTIQSSSKALEVLKKVTACLLLKCNIMYIFGIRIAISLCDDIYPKTSDIRRILVGTKIAVYSDAVGVSPVGATPTTSSFSTFNAWLQWIGQSQLQDETRNI